jgi:TMEM175 potassium channel family protein
MPWESFLNLKCVVTPVLPFGNHPQLSRMKKERIRIKTDRIEFFSDAVIAIIITLMVLEIDLPRIETNATSAQVFQQLGEILPNIFAFMISFAVLGVYWVNHHQFYKAIEYSDWKLLWYNLHFLFWCSLIPLTTALLAEDFDKPAITAVYGVNMLTSAGAFALMHAHTVRRGLFILNLSPKILRRIKRVNILATTLYVISIFAGYISVYISIVIFALVPALYFFPQNVEVEANEND